jgi:putative transposase
MKTILRNILLLQVEAHFPPCSTGRKRLQAGFLLDQFEHMLWTGSPWRALHSDRASYQSLHRHFIAWRDKGIFHKAYEIAYKLHRRPVRRNLRFHCIDTSFVKNIYGRDCIGRNPTDRGRSASKLSALVDQHGLPISLVFFPANRHDTQTVDATLRSSIVVPERGLPLYADKGYDSTAVRRSIREKCYVDRVAARRTTVHRVVNRRRNVVERFFSWLDKSRRLIVRYDTHIASYEAWTWLACIRLLTTTPKKT